MCECIFQATTFLFTLVAVVYTVNWATLYIQTDNVDLAFVGLVYLSSHIVVSHVVHVSLQPFVLDSSLLYQKSVEGYRCMSKSRICPQKN